MIHLNSLVFGGRGGGGGETQTPLRSHFLPRQSIRQEQLANAFHNGFDLKKKGENP